MYRAVVKRLDSVYVLVEIFSEADMFVLLSQLQLVYADLPALNKYVIICKNSQFAGQCRVEGDEAVEAFFRRGRGFAAVCSGFFIAIKFFIDVDLIKNDDRLKAFFRLAAQTALAGLAVLFAGYYFCRYFNGTEIYFFDFETVWVRGDILRTIFETCKTAAIGAGMKSGIAPLYPVLVHLIGAVIFDHFSDAAMLVTFGAAVWFSFEYYLYIKEKYPEKDAEDFSQRLLAAAFLSPFSLLVFIPSPASLALLFCTAALRFIQKKKYTLSWVFIILLLLTDKFGVLLFPVVFYYDRVFSVLEKRANPRMLMYLSSMVTGALLILFIRL